MDYPLKENAGSYPTSIFIGSADKSLPYFIEQFTWINPNFCRIKLEDINNREDALKLCRKDVLVDQKNFENYFEEASNEIEGYQDLAGFNLLDENQKTIGEITEMLVLPGQYLARLKLENKEILIPLNEETVIEINEKANTVIVKIPEGLLDIF